jgi:glycosyltransferase involved in cell wall biosynthesis
MFGKILLLPPPTAGKSGFPWNQEVPPQNYRLEAAQYPKITIVTPSFNQGQFIEQTIRSVLLQNYPNLEYIVMDGGSTDNTLEILEKYSRFITWKSEKDGGQSEAINKGIALGTGELFNWLNSDDYYLPDFLRKIGELYVEQKTAAKECSAICTRSYFVLEDGAISSTNAHTPVFATVLETLARISINQPATFLLLDRVKTLGGVSSALHYSMDWELWFRYLLNCGQAGVVTDEFIGICFRLHGESKTMQETDAAMASKFEENMWQVYRNLAEAGKDAALCKQLDTLGFVKNPDYKLTIPPAVKPADLRQIVHNHLYTKVNKAYYQSAFRRANMFSKMIDSSQLLPTIKKDLRYLRLRIFFKKWFAKA